MALSEAAREQKIRTLREKRRRELVARIEMMDRPPRDMRETCAKMRDSDRGELLALAFREWAPDKNGIAALEPLGLLDDCGNVTVAGLDMAGALLKWSFHPGLRSPWRLDDDGRHGCLECGITLSPQRYGRCTRCLHTP